MIERNRFARHFWMRLSEWGTVECLSEMGIYVDDSGRVCSSLEGSTRLGEEERRGIFSLPIKSLNFVC